MKKWILHILLFAGIFGMLTTSCSQEADDPTADTRSEKEKVMIRFTIALDEPKAASRSWEGYDPESGNYGEVGSVAENYIDANKVQVLIYDLNGVLMGELKEVTVTPVTEAEANNQHLYDLVGAFEADADQVSSLDFKLMVFANTTKMTNLNNIASHSFDYPLADGAGIPMWGIATFEDVDLSNSLSVGTAEELTTPIYMLRSMAKIEVTLSEETAESYALQGATLNKAMKNGIVMPKLRKHDTTTDVAIKDLAATTALGIDEVFNPASGDTQDDAAFTGSGNTYYIYVPEYDASEKGDLEITLDFGSGVTKSFTHGLYSEGAYSNTAWDVVRNHYYKYEVSINSGEDLEIIITIKEWNKRKFTYDAQGLTSLENAATESTN